MLRLVSPVPAFRGGALVSLNSGNTTIIGDLTVRKPTRIVCTFPIGGVPAGVYNLTIINNDGLSVSKINSFTVVQAGYNPVITNFSPLQGVNTESTFLTVNGYEFRNGAIMMIKNSNLSRIASLVSLSPTQVRCILPVKGLPIGEYNISVRNTDGTYNSSDEMFMVMNPVPVISAVSPVSGYNTDQILITVSGARFASGAQICLINGSTLIPGTVKVFNPIKLSVSFPLTQGPAGMYDIRVTNPGSSNFTKSGCFKIIDPRKEPTIIDYFPSSGINSGSQLMVLNGTNFRAGVTVRITNGTNSKSFLGILNGSTQLRSLLSLTGLPIGSYNVTVRNIDGSNVTKTDAFLVSNPTPLITMITPTSGYNTGSLSINVFGMRFVKGAEVSLSNANTTIQGIVSGLKAGTCTALFPLTGYPSGTYNLTMMNPGGQINTKSCFFTLLDPISTPLISNFSPKSGLNLVALPLTMNGTNFRAGATVIISNGSQNRTVLGKVTGNTQITCILPLSGLNAGYYTLTIKNVDGSSNTCSDPFHVMNPSPSITSISPISGYNTNNVHIIITGSRFASGAAITLVNGSITIPGSVTSLLSTSISGSFPLEGADIGRYNLSVSNPSDLNVTKSNAFTILAPGIAPVIISVSPASGFNSQNLPVRITGLNFRTPKVYINQSGLLKLAPVSSSSSTLISAILPISGVSGGLYTITIRNADGVNGTAQDIFFVTDMAWISANPKVNHTEKSLLYVPEVQSVHNPSGKSLMHRFETAVIQKSAIYHDFRTK